MRNYCFMCNSRLKSKFVILIFFCVLTIFLSGILFIKENIALIQQAVEVKVNCDNDYQSHESISDVFFENREHWKTSNLGSILFKNAVDKNEEYNKNSRNNRTYVVLIWKYWNWLKARHVSNYGSGNTDPLQGCRVTNCRFTGNDTDMEIADAVVIHVQRGLIPNVKNRKANQRWVFLSDESPKHTFSLAKTRPHWKDFANVFNWTMTYRIESDVPVPYGRTVPRPRAVIKNWTCPDLAELVPNWNSKQRDVLANILISNCRVKDRMDFLDELQQHIAVDVHGKCSKSLKNSCPGHFRTDCKVMSKYLFYLVLENSICQQYLTEKLFYHAYSKGAIPIIRGPSREDCEKLLPPNSYLHVDNYEDVQELGAHISAISKSNNRLLAFHRWRNNFEVKNEHGYFGTKSYHLCRVCEALNYNDVGSKVYNEKDLQQYFDKDLVCS